MRIIGRETITFSGGGGKVCDPNIDPCLKEKIDLVRKEDEKDRQLDPEKESVDYRIFHIGLNPAGNVKPFKLSEL